MSLIAGAMAATAIAAAVWDVGRAGEGTRDDAVSTGRRGHPRHDRFAADRAQPYGF
jgi:hypothetical protein